MAPCEMHGTGRNGGGPGGEDSLEYPDQLGGVVTAAEERCPPPQLGVDTAHRPDVHRGGVRRLEQHLRRPVPERHHLPATSGQVTGAVSLAPGSKLHVNNAEYLSTGNNLEPAQHSPMPHTSLPAAPSSSHPDTLSRLSLLIPSHLVISLPIPTTHPVPSLPSYPVPSRSIHSNPDDPSRPVRLFPSQAVPRRPAPTPIPN